MAAARHFIKTQGMVLQNTDYRKLLCIISMELRFFVLIGFFLFFGKIHEFWGKVLNRILKVIANLVYLKF